MTVNINVKNAVCILSSCEISLRIHLLPLCCLASFNINLADRMVGKLEKFKRGAMPLKAT